MTCCPPAASGRSSRRRSRNLWDHLVHHLHGAGEIPELAKTVTNPVYLITRTFLRGPTAAEADLRRTTELLTDLALEWWQQWFDDYGHLIAGLESLTHTAATAALRLTDAPVLHSQIMG